MKEIKPVDSEKSEGKYPRVTVRMPQHLLDEIEKVCKNNPDVKSRSAGIKYLIKKGLLHVSV